MGFSSRLAVVLFGLSLLDQGSCSLNISCKPQFYKRVAWNAPPETSMRAALSGKEHSCYITEFPIPNPDRGAHNIYVEYDHPNNIKHVEFIPTGKRFLTIEKVPTQIFSNFPNLNAFIMCSTNLLELHSNDFSGANNLTTLLLNRNKLKIIRSSVFSPLTEMERSLLRLAKITKVEWDTEYLLHKLLYIAAPW